VLPHAAGEFDGLENVVLLHPAQHEGALLQRLGSLGGGTHRDGWEAEDGGLFRDAAAVGEDAVGVELEFVVVEEAERLEAAHERVEDEAALLDEPLAARVGGVDDGHGVRFRDCVDGAHQGEEVLLVVDVLLPVGGEQEVAPRLQAERLQRVGREDALLVARQHLGHGRAGDVDVLLAEPFGEQVAPRVLGVRQVDVGDGVDDAAVGLLGEVLVEAAVPRLHVEDGDLQPFGRYRREGGVGVAQDEQRVGTFGLHHLERLGDDVADGLPQVLADGVEVVVRLAEAQVLEKDLVQRVVPVLPRVDEDVVEVEVHLFEDLAQADDLRARTHDRHDFQAMRCCFFVGHLYLPRSYGIDAFQQQDSTGKHAYNANRARIKG